MVGLLTFWREGAGSVVHNRESPDIGSPEVDISATFTPSEIIQSQKTVTSVLVNDRSRVGRRNLQTWTILHELITCTFLHI